MNPTQMTNRDQKSNEYLAKWRKKMAQKYVQTIMYPSEFQAKFNIGVSNITKVWSGPGCFAAFKGQYSTTNRAKTLKLNKFMKLDNFLVEVKDGVLTWISKETETRTNVIYFT